MDNFERDDAYDYDRWTWAERVHDDSDDCAECQGSGGGAYPMHCLGCGGSGERRTKRDEAPDYGDERPWEATDAEVRW